MITFSPITVLWRADYCFMNRQSRRADTMSCPTSCLVVIHHWHCQLLTATCRRLLAWTLPKVVLVYTRERISFYASAFRLVCEVGGDGRRVRGRPPITLLVVKSDGCAAQWNGDLIHRDDLHAFAHGGYPITIKVNFITFLLLDCLVRILSNLPLSILLLIYFLICRLFIFALVHSIKIDFSAN